MSLRTNDQLFALSLLFLLPGPTARSVLILAVMVVFVAIGQCFISIVTWLLLSGLFPMKIRGFAVGIAVFALWMVNFSVSQVFPSLDRAAGSTVTFLLFAGLGILSLVFVARYVPETKGHSLEDLEAGFRDRYSHPPIRPARPASSRLGRIQRRIRPTGAQGGGGIGPGSG